MINNNSRKGITITEALIACIITGVITLAAVQMIGSMYEGQVGYNQNIRAKQQKNLISERISSRVKEGVKAYYDPLTITITYDGNSYSVLSEKSTLAVLIPKFDASGDVVQPSSGVTTFIGVAYSIVQNPESPDSPDYVLLETNTEFDLMSSISDPYTINQSLPTDWSSGTSYIVSEGLTPATFTNMNTDAFDVEGDMVNFAFVPSGGSLYFASDSGSVSIDDGEYITRCQFRNFRI